MPKRKRKEYSRPQKPFDKTRIEEENVLKERYGLKNKKEIWKADAAIGRIRNLAKQLITKSEEEKQAFIGKLQKKGFKIESIADSLALNKEDWLKRRLQTIVFSTKLTNTPKQARQLITHKHVSVGERIVNIPSYQINLEEETQVKLNLALKLKQEKKEIIKPSPEKQVEEEPVEVAKESPEKEIKEEPKEKSEASSESPDKETKEESK